MKPVRTTVLGGLIFLVPFAVVLLVFGKVFAIAMRLAEPIDRLIPVERLAGVALVNLLAILIILLACYLAGRAASSYWGRKIHHRLDEWLLTLIPRYAFVRSLAESVEGQDESTLTPVLIRLDDMAQIAFEVERGPGDMVTVYLPGSPDPWSGSVAQIESQRVEPLAADFAKVVKSLRKIGRDAHNLFSDDPS